MAREHDRGDLEAEGLEEIGVPFKPCWEDSAGPHHGCRSSCDFHKRWKVAGGSRRGPENVQPWPLRIILGLYNWGTIGVRH